MSNTKIGIAGVLVVCAVIAVWVGIKPGTDDTDPATSSTHQGSAVQDQTALRATQSNVVQPQKTSPKIPDDVKEAYPQIADRLDAMQQRRPNLNFDPAEVAAATQRESAWAPAQETPKNLPLEAEELTDGREFIQLDSLKIETLMPGDSVKVAIQDTGEIYTVEMDRVEKHDYNSISWYGHIDGQDGQTYQVSFTRGESLTVGGLSTPDGHYVLQAHGNNGWVASSALLFKSDPNVPDVVYPEDVMDAEATHIH